MTIKKIFLFKLWLYFIHYFTKPVVGFFLFFKLKIRYHKIKTLYKVSPPYVVLANHTHQWDPFILSWVSPYPICWVASQAAFRSSFKNPLLAVGAIPKMKEQSDMRAIQTIKERVQQNLLIGIFPEGKQNWDGLTDNLIPATAKLLRFLKIPIVVPLLKGAYFSRPRWAWESNKSPIDIDFSCIIDADEIKTLSLSEIEKRMKEALHFDVYEWQRKKMTPIPSKRRAESMELALWACPSCQGMKSMRSKDHILFCESCHYSVTVNPYGFLVYPDNAPSFLSPRAWISWQNDLLLEHMKGLISSSEHDDPVLLQENNVTLMGASDGKAFFPLHEGEARLYQKRLEIGPADNKAFSFLLEEIKGINTFQQQKFEFSHGQTLYRFQFSHRHVSGYQWEIAHTLLRKL